ncbi:MAG: alanine--tRNA ligase [Neisseriaceae bacterium]|nr:alanine--tRNA ligase [Neisseriaceae bacterium]MBP6863267.1 alanine--tRNA ligase [Neisseriaceae bacterium]
MKTAQIRQKFLHFFESKGHQIVASSSLVPHEDPTLLFTNAGMNQFKDVFLGFDQRPYNRATSSQKCVRAGGKHNDLENVGYTARHHTFFEMLGNFSFGDYFKRDAIHFAWEFLTSPEWLNLPKDKLLATVYATDDEAFDIWAKEIGMPEEKIIRIGDNKGGQYASDNFWQMGDTGPCGPCSEIFFDHGEHLWGGPPGSPEEDGDRFIEIWNCVFMQFNRDEAGTMHPLPKPSVDTGMGLERISAVMQHVNSNYEIDLFQNLVKAAARETGVAFSLEEPSLKVLADHIRACSFLIADGVLPSNEGRGYVLRRIIRRAVRHGYKLGQKGAFFHKMVPDLVAEMGEAFPELVARQQVISDALKLEESRFAQTLEHGMTLLEQALAGGKQELAGEVVFKLYDTYGFPYDLTADICRERNIVVDEAGFETEMEAQRNRARAASSFKMDTKVAYEGADTEFEGYTQAQTEAKVLALYHEGESVPTLADGQEGIVVLDHTPFYAESGGQVGDVGFIEAAAGRFEVRDTQKIKAAVSGQQGIMLSGNLSVGDTVKARIDETIRAANMRNHSATHLMHTALRTVLGEHVAQKGSLVNAERTRFDFTHPQAVTPAQIAEVEALVNQAILANVDVTAKLMGYDEAIKAGAMALFGEKYGDEVRVLQMGEFSTELCGGTHVQRTGDIGLFKITSEGGVAAGIRRVEAVTGLNVLALVQSQEQLIKDTMHELKVQTPQDVVSKIHQLQEQGKQLEKSLAQAKVELAQHAGAALLENAASVGDFKLVVATLADADANVLRDTVTGLTGKGDNVVVLLAAESDGKVSLCAGVSKAATKQVKAGDLVKFVAEQVGGKGGGRPDLAQAGGTDVAALAKALDSVAPWLAAV